MRRLSCWLFVLLALPTAAAQADPIPAIRITSGSLVIDSEGIATMDLVGTNSFIMHTDSGIHQFGTGCASDCFPGQLFEVVGNLDDVSGSARVLLPDGPFDVPHFSDDDAHFNFFGDPAPIPGAIKAHVVLTAPFEFRGGLALRDDERFPFGSPGLPLSGRGIARIELMGQPGASTFSFVQSRYSFGEVPEPGTLALLMTGLVAGWRRRRHHGLGNAE